MQNCDIVTSFEPADWSILLVNKKKRANKHTIDYSDKNNQTLISGIRVNCEVNEAANTKIVPTGAIIRLLSDNNFVFDLHNRVVSKCK